MNEKLDLRIEPIGTEHLGYVDATDWHGAAKAAYESYMGELLPHVSPFEDLDKKDQAQWQAAARAAHYHVMAPSLTVYPNEFYHTGNQPRITRFVEAYDPNSKPWSIVTEPST